MGISFLDRENHPRHPDFDNIGGRCEGVKGVGRRRRTDYAVVFKVNVWNENELFYFE